MRVSKAGLVPRRGLILRFFECRSSLGAQSLEPSACFSGTVRPNELLRELTVTQGVVERKTTIMLPRAMLCVVIAKPCIPPVYRSPVRMRTDLSASLRPARYLRRASCSMAARWALNTASLFSRLPRNGHPAPLG
jgi:hypothetical protein